MFFPQVVLILIKSISSRTLRIGINGGNCSSRSSTGLQYLFIRIHPEKNKIPQAIIEQLDEFILQEIGNAGRCKKGILSLFLHSFLDNMYHSEKFMNPVENYQNGVATFRHFQRTLTRCNTYVTNHLQSTEWLKRVPKVGHLEQDDVSTLVFTYFLLKIFFSITSSMLFLS
ncbi:hypothetical protein P4909_17890 [Escherichia coli]